MNKSGGKIIIVGLGYVGLPLAVALAESHPDMAVVGFDIDGSRIDELRKGIDRTLEVDAAALESNRMAFTDRDDDCQNDDIIIVTVPSPVDERNKLDLGTRLAEVRRGGGSVDN